MSWYAQRAKTGGWIGVRPDGEGHHTVPERASLRPWRHGRQKATLARLCLPTVVVRKTLCVFRDDENPEGSRTTRRAGRPIARPVPGRGETCVRGHPRRLSETTGMHGASGYRVRMDAQHATPLAGPTYRARTRYRLAGLHPAGETLPAGTRDRPAVPRWNPRASTRGGCQRRPPADRGAAGPGGLPFRRYGPLLGVGIALKNAVTDGGESFRSQAPSISSIARLKMNPIARCWVIESSRCSLTASSSSMKYSFVWTSSRTSSNPSASSSCSVG